MRRNVLEYLDETAECKPQHLAFSDGEEGMTFAQTAQASRALGSFLCGRSIYKQPVVVFMRKSPQAVSAFFGVVAGGDFYVPIDAEMPQARIRLILEQIRAPLMICDAQTIGAAQEMDGWTGCTVLYDDIVQTAVDHAALRRVRENAIDTDPIYIVFTSGSTGVPKGVAACHRSVIDYTEHLSEILRLNEETVFGNQSPLYFDACLKELYPTLKFGAVTYLIPKKLFSLPLALLDYLDRHRINTICWVVSAMTMVSAFGALEQRPPRYLRTVAFGSETFPIQQFRRWRTALPQTDFVHLYGPTEGTGMCCYYRVEEEIEEGGVIPIGRPFPNCEILLLTERGEAAGAGETGEMYLRGTAVTLGYYNDTARTSEVFVQNPMHNAYPEIVYRTGDLARRSETGDLIFLSRKDNQIKHMGHRIELGEIEAAVNALPCVALCACVFDRERKRIALYYVGDGKEAEMPAMLKERLPRYMMPHRIEKRQQMPFTPNGKIDRAALLREFCQR